MDRNNVMIFILVVLCVVFTIGSGKRNTGVSLATNDAKKFLAKYKYFNETVAKAALQGGEVPAGIMAEAIRKFQVMVNLDVTGVLDLETVYTMNQPRCGVADLPEDGDLDSDIAGNIWHKRLLTWTVSAYSQTSSLTEYQQRKAIERGLDIWARKIPLRFQYRTQGPADLNFKFVVGHHGDGLPFDGFCEDCHPGNALAHAFPPTDSRIHFDDEETWLLGRDAHLRGTDLYIVAAHEIGHALGLKHSSLPGTLMYPFYKYTSNLQLHQNDIDRIQYLYGKPLSVQKFFL